MKKLGVEPPDIEPEATAHMPQIIAMIEQLIERQHAYVAMEHVLFAVNSFADYGQLSRRDTGRNVGRCSSRRSLHTSVTQAISCCGNLPAISFLAGTRPGGARPPRLAY